MDTKELPVDEKQAAAFLGVSVHWMRRSRWAGNGPVFIKYESNGANGAVRYLPSELERFRESRTRKSTSDTGAAR
jgi:hypothetical protein